MSSKQSHRIDDSRGASKLSLRGFIGGSLMGLANLVPGISGGTMLLAAGVYPGFITAIAELTTLKFRFRSILLLGVVVVSAACAILLLAGTVKGLVVDHRWIMYSLFIGLTLGGVPVVWKMLRIATAGTWIGAAAGFATMGLLAWLQVHGAATGVGPGEGPGMLFVAGLAGASAMILPGVSGGYLLLILGQYVPILSAIDSLKMGLNAGEWATVFDVCLQVCVPVGIGVVVGIAGVSNLLGWLLKRAEKTTLGVLLGLLLGAVVGLWPFQEGVSPQIGDTIKGQVLTEDLLAELDPEDYPTKFFHPSGRQLVIALILTIVGFSTTALIARFGQEEAGPS